MENNDDYRPITIKGKDYLPMDYVLTSGNKGKCEKMKSLGCITQRIKESKAGLYSGGYAIITVLVPFDKIEEFEITNE